jgi:hypothetical protein
MIRRETRFGAEGTALAVTPRRIEEYRDCGSKALLSEMITVTIRTPVRGESPSYRKINSCRSGFSRDSLLPLGKAT